MQSEPNSGGKAKGRRIGALAVLGCLLGAIGYAGFALLARQAAAPSERAEQEQAALDAAIARIDAESRGELAAAPSSPQLPAETQAAFSGNAMEDAAPEATAPELPTPIPEPPEGYSFVGVETEMAKAPMPDGAAGEPMPADDGLDWLGAPGALPALAHQSEAAGRDWSFGWVRAARDAGPEAAKAALEDAGVEVLGASGALLRAKLPGDPESLRALSALPEVAGLGAVPRERKVAAAFAEQALAAPPHQRTPVFITLMADDPQGRWRRQLQALGATIGRFDPDIRAYAAHIANMALDDIIRQDFVLAVEPIGMVRAAHDTAVPAMGADALRRHAGSPGLFSGIGGASVPIAVMDTGLNINHLDIATNRQSICGANFVYFDRLLDEADLWLDDNGHGTHVTGTIAGNGFVEPRYVGMAPRVQHIRFAKVLSHLGHGTSDSILRGMDWLARPTSCAEAGWSSARAKPLIVNMSLSATRRVYEGRGFDERKLDSIVWSQRQLYVVAQSNADIHGFSNYASAKNSLAVGAALDSGEIAGFSSHGPTADGRLAPQVVATGVGIYSAKGEGSRGHYASLSGTSMAAPSVAGLAALLMDSAPAHRERPALARARLMASAIKPDVWLDGPSQFPADNSNGPGALQAQYGLGKASARTSALNREQADGWVSGGAVSSLQNGEYAYRDIEVPANTSRLDLVMTWDEPPTDTIGQAVLNDLDLWLDRDGDCGVAACGERSSTSRKDNVEWIILRNPSPGTYRAKILPRRIHGAAPRAALAWTLIRGPSTPQLRIQASRSEIPSASRSHDLTLTVTADGYVAAGARLHVACDAQDLSACSRAGIANLSSTREDGIANAPVDISLGESVELGEIAVGERQEVSFRLASDGPVRFYFMASAWNAKAALASVGFGEAAPAVAERPANDGFSAPATLEGGNGALALDLRLATSEPGEPAFNAGGARPAGSLWHLWTAPAGGLAQFGVSQAEGSEGGASSAVKIHVFQGDQIAWLEPVASNLWGASFFASQGETYRIRVSQAAGAGSPLDLHWSQQRPANDDFSQAIALSGAEGAAEGSNQGATLEPGEQFGPLAATVWHRWQAPADGAWRFTADGSAKVLAFTGSAVAELRLVSGYPGNSAIFPARAGEIYRIAIAAADAFAGGRRYRLSWREESREDGGNDDFANAQEMEGRSSSISVLLQEGSTVEPGEPAETGVRTRWWTWTAPEDGRYAWRLADPTYRGIQVTAFASSPGGEEAQLENLQLVGATGPDFASTQFAFDALAGRRYWFAVGYAASELEAFQWPLTVAILGWAPTPENDELADAALLSGASGDVGGSNAFATTERGERAGREGHSSLWWAWEAPAAGWYRFQASGDTPFTLAAYQGDGDGFSGLGSIVSSYIGWQGEDDGPAEVVFYAEQGVRYWVRLGSPTETPAGKFKLQWDETEAPTWLKYAGRLGAAQLGLDQWGVNIGGLAFEDLGATLYMQSDLGLHVLERDAATGALKPVRIIENSLTASSVLAWDSRRTRLYAQDCATWRQFASVGENRRELGSDALPAPEGFSGACAGKMFMDPTGEFLFLASNAGIDTFAFDSSDRLQHVNRQSADSLQDAVISKGGGTVHALVFGQLLSYGRDAGTGGLSLLSETWLTGPARTLAASDDGRHLFIFTVNGATTVYALEGGLANAQFMDTILHFGNRGPSRRGDPCLFSAIRRDRPAADVFCADRAFSVEYRLPEADAQAPGALAGSDHIANWQPDRFNNHVPEFTPAKGIASPDGKHFYVATNENDILHFERIGNPVISAAPPGDEPDLTAGFPRTDSGSLAPGASFSLRTLVYNQGGADASATTVRWRRSSDAAIDAEDEQVGLGSLQALAASASSEASISLTAPSSAGVHYYGVCADALPDESRAGNNCSAGALFRVEAPDDGGGDDGGGGGSDGGDDDHGNSHDRATDLAIPSSVAGSLERPGDLDFFRIVLEQDAGIELWTTGETDTYGTLRYPDRTRDDAVIAQIDDDGNDLNFRIKVDLAAGTYFLEVKGFAQSTGDYTLEARIW